MRNSVLISIKVIIIFLFSFLFLFVSLTHALTPTPSDCPIFLKTTPLFPFDTDDVTLVFRNDDNHSYSVKIDNDNSKIFRPSPINGTSVQIGRHSKGTHSFEILLNTIGTISSNKSCGTKTFTVEKTPTSCIATISQTAVTGEPISAIINFDAALTGQAELKVETADGLQVGRVPFNIVPRKNIEIPSINQPGRYRVGISQSKLLCISNFIDVVASPTPTPGGPTLTPSDPNQVVTLPTSVPTSVPTTPIPPGFPCATLDPGTKECKAVKTAIGNINTKPEEFIKTIFTVLLSMAGGWAVYLIITAGYQLMFSGHEAEKVQEARDKITSAIVGLVFMILSLIILRIIGVDIFQLPTFIPPK